MKNKKNIFIWAGLLLVVIIITTFVLLNNKDKQSNYDPREEWCIWKEIEAVEFNIDTQECFETKISACQTPTFKSIEECKKLNWVE